MEPTFNDFASLNAMHTSSPQPSECIWLEAGHTYEPRCWKSGRAVPEDWCVWVRGVAGADITALVDKVVFQLRPDTQFPFPKKICLEAPYKVEEAGSAPIDVIIDVHLKCSSEPEVFRFHYGRIFDKPEHSSANSRCFCYNIKNSTGKSKKKRNDRFKQKKSKSPAPQTPSYSFSKIYHQLNEEYKKIMSEERTKSGNTTHRSCLRCLTRVMPCPRCQPRRIPHSSKSEATNT